MVNVKEYQEMAEKTARKLEDSDKQICFWGLGISGEAGDVASCIKKEVFHDNKKVRGGVREGLGDVMWYAAMICNFYGWSLDEIMDENLAKLRERYNGEGFSLEAAQRGHTMKKWSGDGEGEVVSQEMDKISTQSHDVCDAVLRVEKVVLVDAVHCLVDAEGNVNEDLKSYLDSLPNRKIVLTNAPYEKHNLFFRNIKDWEIFTLEFNPGKDNPNYYRRVLEKFDLNAEDVVYFEHKKEAMGSALSVGIDVMFYDGDVEKVKKFVDSKLEVEQDG